MNNYNDFDAVLSDENHSTICVCDACDYSYYQAADEQGDEDFFNEE